MNMTVKDGATEIEYEEHVNEQSASIVAYSLLPPELSIEDVGRVIVGNDVPLWPTLEMATNARNPEVALDTLKRVKITVTTEIIN